LYCRHGPVKTCPRGNRGHAQTSRQQTQTSGRNGRSDDKFYHRSSVLTSLSSWTTPQLKGEPFSLRGVPPWSLPSPSGPTPSLGISSFFWSEIWDTERARKESGLLWRCAHRAVAVNVWRGRISRTIVLDCPVCTTREAESIEHRFWSCPASQQVWMVYISLLRILSPQDNVAGLDIHWRRTMLDDQLDLVSQATQSFWLLIRDVTMWQLWLMRNRLIFQRERWKHALLCFLIWQNIIDYPLKD
jgi:hypothetical protein